MYKQLDLRVYTKTKIRQYSSVHSRPFKMICEHGFSHSFRNTFVKTGTPKLLSFPPFTDYMS